MSVTYILYYIYPTSHNISYVIFIKLKIEQIFKESAYFYIFRYLEIQKYVDIEMETIITSFISLLLELIHIVVHLFDVSRQIIEFY